MISSFNQIIMKKKARILIFPLIVMGIILMLTNSCKKDDNSDGSTVKDIDGNVYDTVRIGTQVWMVENLKTTKYNDGTSIPLVTDDTEWENLGTPGYCWFNNDAATYKSAYGALYNWYSVNTGKLCPTGWHVPTDAEWTILIDYLGGEGVAGGKMKEAGLTHWPTPNTGATNSSGFTALPGGCRGDDNFSETFRALFWSSSQCDATTAWYRSLYFNYESIDRGYYDFGGYKHNGFSVRCVKD